MEATEKRKERVRKEMDELGILGYFEKHGWKAGIMTEDGVKPRLVAYAEKEFKGKRIRLEGVGKRDFNEATKQLAELYIELPLL